MALPLIPLLAAGLLGALAIYKLLIYPTFLFPLSKIPAAHWSAPISSLWIWNARRTQRETFTVHSAHQRLGPMVRLAPNEISVNSVDGGIRTIYAGGYEKGDWYLNVFTNYGIQPMFAMPDHARHSKRKRMLSNVYAKSTLQGSETMHGITRTLVYERFIPRLQQLAREGKPVEFYTVFQAITTDFVSSYVFGLASGSNFISEPNLNLKFFRDYKARQAYQFWPQDLPNFTRWMVRLGLDWVVFPQWVREANNDIEGWIMSMLERAEEIVRRSEVEGEKGRAEDWPTVYMQLRTALLKEAGKVDDVQQTVRDLRLTLASEMLDHTLAGFDTSSITLVFLAWELSLPHNKIWQERLRAEIADSRLTDNLENAKELDALPILHAILMETLRLHAAIPGNQPRITPPNATLGSPDHQTFTSLPAGVRVQAQAWSLHRNPLVFPNPEAFNPARWLPPSHKLACCSEVQQREMQRWFWAFGSGGRMCVGSNLAMLDMKAIVAAVWSRVETSVVDGRGMVHNGTYVAEPVGTEEGRYLVLGLEEVSGVKGEGS